MGFIEIVETYSGTKSANLAHYYLGIAYRNMGMFEDAIYELKEFSSDDVIISAVALGAIGDSYMELNDIENAVDYYEKAAAKNSNKLTSPIYLFKAGIAYETLGDYANAVKKYKEIKKDFAESPEARDVEKYIARAETMSEK